MTDLPFAGREVEPGDTPEQTVARYLALFWGKTFSEPMTEDHFIAQATKIVREVRGPIAKEAVAEVRDLLRDAHSEAGRHLIDELYWAAGQAKLEGRSDEVLLGHAADLLARLWVRVNDGTLDPPNWVGHRQDHWVQRFR